MMAKPDTKAFSKAHAIQKAMQSSRGLNSSRPFSKSLRVAFSHTASGLGDQTHDNATPALGNHRDQPRFDNGNDHIITSSA